MQSKFQGFSHVHQAVDYLAMQAAAIYSRWKLINFEWTDACTKAVLIATWLLQKAPLSDEEEESEEEDNEMALAMGFSGFGGK